MITISHGGDIGDIIYSLPTVKAILKKEKKKQCIFYLYLNQQQARMNRTLAEFIKPLLLYQPYIKEVNIVENLPKIDYNLDVWRQHKDIRNRHIAFAHADSQHLEVDISKAWLKVPKVKKFDVVLLARSGRNRSKNFRWNEVFKGMKGKFAFVGTVQEFEEMHFQGVPHLKVKDALHLAKHIKACNLFVGNQSFPYALAEATKVNRIQETSESAPNCLPFGDNAWTSRGSDTNSIIALISLYS